MSGTTEAVFDLSAVMGAPLHWENPQGTELVAVDPTAASRLRSHVIEAFLSLPKRGAEVGGFLLGRVDSVEPFSVTVEDFEPLPCEHRFGPSYILSEGDRRRGAELLRQLQTERDLAIVGFYRSYTGRDATLDTADAETVRSYVKDARAVLLLIQPVSARECTARFQLLGDQEGRPEDAVAPEAASVPVPETDIWPLRQPEPSQPVEPVRLPEPFRSLRPTHDEPTRARRPRFWLPFLLCLLGSIGLAFVYELWQMAREPRWTPLALDATRGPDGVLLSWDGSAPAVADTSRGALSITDGALHKEVPLGQADLRSGKFLYKPNQSDVLFRLYLYHSQLRESGDSLRWVSAPAPAPAPPRAVSAPAPPPLQPPPAAPPVAKGTEAGRPAKAEGAVVRPPMVLHEVHPGIPAGIRARIGKSLEIPVEVNVSASGRVTQAVAKPAGDGLSRYLGGEAARAARLWTFRPARSKQGTPVASSTTVYFVFTR